MAKTTTKPDTLANGAELLGKMQVTVRSSGATGWIILAKRDHPYEPFVTWLSIDGHHCESGSYFETRDQAVESFFKRILVFKGSQPDIISST
tara:strand:+ start:173 stop:448 length:276 start_codon:yes stop_codon:yes gene_type:complete